MKLQENIVFANRYELQRLLGRGGFSEVWLAKDQWTHLNVAIKVYAPGQGMEEDGMREFCGELAGVYDINHSNLLKPQHVDAWENMPYLIMAYCPNGSCAKLIGKVTEEQMWKMIHDVASGLAYLHEKGLVHQDIKPANVMIDEDGHYLITDFGVSSRARSTLRKSVISSTGGGTTAYMGPERFSKQPAPTKASDIWSFGAMCFEMLEGEVPFGENGGLSQRLSAEIPLMKANISDALKFTITKMLQKETWDRPTAATLVEWSSAPQRINIDRSLISDEPAAQPYVESSRPTTRRDNAPAAEPEVRATARQDASANPVSETPPSPKKNWKKWSVVGLVLLLLVVACIVIFGRKGEPVTDEDFELVADVESDTKMQIEVEDSVAYLKIQKEAKSGSLKDKEIIEKEKLGVSENREPLEEKPKKTNIGSRKETFTVNGVTFTMVKVEGGTFQMGSNSGDSYEKPVHSVTLSDYYIGETEVTQALWQAVMGSNPSSFKGDNLPVEQVSWDDCQEFIRKLNQKTGRRFALPTEAQWEFAAQGGNKSRGYEYSGSNNIGSVAWYTSNSSNKTHPVGTKMVNELGLYDMSGNVWEWCSDWYGSYSSSSQTDPTGPSTGSNRVYRGGGWNRNASGCRSAYRGLNNPDSRFNFYGFRLVLLF